MGFLQKLEYRLGRYAVRNLITIIVLGMALVFVCDLLFAEKMAQIGGIWANGVSGLLSMDRELVLSGQVWRLVTFVFVPPSSGIYFMVFALYFYWMIGSALERDWGSFRFGVYYLCGIIGTIISGFITGWADNSYLNMSLFFAFAMLYPNFEMRIFFILPVKVKWLAWLDGALFILLFIIGNWSIKAAILAAMLNFFLFFGKDFINSIKSFIARSKYRGSVRRGERENRNYWKNR